MLQRFGIAYFFVSSLYVIFYPREVAVGSQHPIRKLFHDIVILWRQWAVMLAVVLVHLLITFLLPVPGCPTGYLGPGGIHEMGRYNNCIGGATGYIDRVVLGEQHLYQHPTAKHVYHSDAFDPEGVFGCLLTIFQVFLGVQCGVILLVHGGWKERVQRWLAWAVVTALIGGALCGFSQEDGIIPLNKNMWYVQLITN